MLSSLKDELKQLHEKRRDHEVAINTCKAIINEKEKTIQKLTESLSKNQFERETNLDKSESSEVTSALRFHSFSNTFTNETLAKLRLIGTSLYEDSTFVLNVVKFLYNDRLSCLKNKSVSGRGAKAEENKTKITPEKMEIMKSIYAERIDSVTEHAYERENRRKKLNKFIKDAIGTINKQTDARRRLDFANNQIE